MKSNESDVGWSRDDLESVASCPACGCPESRPIYTGLVDWLERTSGKWEMRTCNRCQSMFLDPRPNVRSIHKAYASYYTHGSGRDSYLADNGKSVLWRLANGYMNARYGMHRRPAQASGRWLLPLLPILRQQIDFFCRNLPARHGRLLDIGCGNGTFLLRAIDAGWSVMGLEPDEIAAASSRGSGLDVVTGVIDDFEDPHGFDAITVSHVIEHVHAPRAFLERISANLRAGGFIWIATPNARSVGRYWFGRAWRGLEPPRHLTVLTAKALKCILLEAGFTDIKFHCRGRGSKYILNSSRVAARAYGLKRVGLPSMLIDILATVFPRMAEELIVTARKGSY